MSQRSGPAVEGDGTILRKARLTLIVLLLVPAVAQAKVRVSCDSPRRAETFWAVRQELVRGISTNLPLLLSSIPRLGYLLSIGEPANLPEGRWYLFPVCPDIGIYPQGKLVSSVEERTTIRCP